jgi:protein-arginine kinase activator protein McsA
MKIERLFCVRCGIKTPQALIFPSRKEEGNEYVSICSLCLSSSSVYLKEKDRSNFITFFCLSDRCQMRVRGEIIGEGKKEDEVYDRVIALCPFCGRKYEFILKKHR